MKTLSKGEMSNYVQSREAWSPERKYSTNVSIRDEMVYIYLCLLDYRNLSFTKCQGHPHTGNDQLTPRTKSKTSTFWLISTFVSSFYLNCNFGILVICINRSKQCIVPCLHQEVTPVAKILNALITDGCYYIVLEFQDRPDHRRTNNDFISID